jgi:hypothetical protein
MTEARRNAATLAISAIMSLVLLEAAFRIWQGLPLLDTTNFRNLRMVSGALVGATYDPALGWTLAPDIKAKELNTLAFGIRTNDRQETAIRTGGALAVGDSFTAGSEVNDGETWPAQLEGLTGVPVLNAGIGGFGADQIIMRAEQLLPVVRPRTLLVGFLSSDIERASFSVYGVPKPYYIVGNNGLELRNSPVPSLSPPDDALAPLKNVMGHSLVAHRAALALAPHWWLASMRASFVRTGVDGVDITCHLLGRLKRRTDTLSIRTLLVLQYGASVNLAEQGPPMDARLVTECAQKMGIQVVDEWSTLNALAKSDMGAFRNSYVITSNAYGHMSGYGNAIVARLIAAALAQAPVVGSADDFSPDPLPPGDGHNLFPSSEALDKVFTTAATALTRVAGRAEDPAAFRLTATGPSGEHYAISSPLDLAAGLYTVGVDIRIERGSAVRVMLLDEHQNGPVGDFDFTGNQAVGSRLGTTRNLSVRMQDIGGEWRRLQLVGSLSSGNPRVFLQVGNADGALAFAPADESILVRGLQVERGGTASKYVATSGPLSPGFQPGDGRNLIAADWLSGRTAPAQATIREALHRGNGAAQYLLQAEGGEGEHYVVMPDIALSAGPHTLSLQIHETAAAHLRLQIQDPRGTGALADFRLDRRTVMMHRGGKSSNATIDPMGDGWIEVTLTTALTSGGAHLFFQLLSADGSAGFSPNGEVLLIRRVQLERGQSVRHAVEAARATAESSR